MPTLLRKKGFKFFFYANEHEPKHIHVLKSGHYAKIDITTLKVTKNYMKPSDLKKAIEIVKVHQQDFERQWDEYFSR